MPTYEYACKCGHEFEELQSITSKPEAKCPKCGKKAKRQISAGAGLIFKGSGFYITDYKKSGSSPASTESSSSEKSASESSKDSAKSSGSSESSAPATAKGGEKKEKSNSKDAAA